MDALLRHVPQRQRIESFWEEPANQDVGTWTEHEDINTAMLVTSIRPNGYPG